MKLYFGREPKNVDTINLDIIFLNYLRDENYNMNIAINRLSEIFSKDNDTVYHSINPLIINYFEDSYAEYLYMIDNMGEEFYLGEDEHFLNKLSCMGLGEALVDDARSFD